MTNSFVTKCFLSPKQDCQWFWNVTCAPAECSNRHPFQQKIEELQKVTFFFSNSGHPGTKASFEPRDPSATTSTSASLVWGLKACATTAQCKKVAFKGPQTQEDDA